MTKFTFIFVFLYFTLSPTFGQKTRKDIDRFSSDSIQGVYIPKDLEDCFNQINTFLNDSTKFVVRGLSEEQFSTNAHFGLGMWMRNNWQLWGGSRLSKYFNGLGIFHPDDMSGIILDSYYRHLFKKDIKLVEQIQYYKDYWEKSSKKELEDKKEFLEYVIGDTVLYNYLSGFTTPKQEKDFLNNKCVAKGIITEVNEEKLLIKVRLIESCVRKGVIYFDSDNTRIYNEKTKRLEKPIKREIKYMKKGLENWFSYLDWEPDK
jgi:hypothetical protein